MSKGKRLEINPGDTFPNKHWKVIKEIDKRNGARYFLCECLLCNRKYEVQLRGLVSEDESFCCRSCAQSIKNKADDLVGKIFGRLTVISKHSQDKNGGWKYLCKCECGNTKAISGQSLKRHLTTSCGCYRNELSSERLSGENHPNWKDGISTQNALDRSHISHAINPIVRNRDNYTCQNCNQYGGYLECHHIYDFSTYPLLRFNEYNIITLCEKCHYDFHKMYSGILTNTLQNLEDWTNKEYKYHQSLTNYFEYYYN